MLFGRVDKQDELVSTTRHFTTTIVLEVDTRSARSNTSKHILSLQRPHLIDLATSTTAQVAMRGHFISAADDIIVEPIEEAVAVYDKLLKELRKSMVSTSLHD